MFRTLLAFGAFLLLASPAHAQLEVCNKTTDEIAVAIAYDSDQDTISEGWQKIAPTACAEIISTPLNQPYYYYYAITKAQSLQWTGPYRFCAADETNFRIKGASACEERGYRTLGYSQFSVGNYKTFSFNIRSDSAPEGELKAPAAAPAVTAPPVTSAPVPALTDTNVPPETLPPVEAPSTEQAPPVTEAPATTEAAPAEDPIQLPGLTGQ